MEGIGNIEVLKEKIRDLDENNKDGRVQRVEKMRQEIQGLEEECLGWKKYHLRVLLDTVKCTADYEDFSIGRLFQFKKIVEG